VKGLLKGLVVVAVLVSIVHYTDNYFNYDDYPQPSSGPAPSAAVVGLAWFFFTAFALAGVHLYSTGRIRPAAICLAIYSGSGLVGIGHYTVPGATDMPWWRQAHVIADISCGIAVLAFAVWAARRPRARPYWVGPTGSGGRP
jgi:hypothetical protein